MGRAVIGTIIMITRMNLQLLTLKLQTAKGDSLKSLSKLSIYYGLITSKMTNISKTMWSLQFY